jgi:hypothetical protein
MVVERSMYVVKNLVYIHQLFNTLFAYNSIWREYLEKISSHRINDSPGTYPDVVPS